MAGPGGLHHLELWVDDLAASERAWGWLLTEVGHRLTDTWERGRSWTRGDTYVVLESGPALTPGGHDRLRAGLNHLAFHAGPPAEVDRLAAAAPAHGWTLLFADRHPHAGGPGTHNAYLADDAGFEVELVGDVAAGTVPGASAAVDPAGAPVVQLLLVGGRSGVGKSSVGDEVATLLSAAGVSHCLLDGDAMDASWPKPADDPLGTALTERNTAAVWSGYAALGHTRAVYVNTSAVLESAMLARAVGGRVELFGVLLTATDATVRDRLGRREVGSGLERQLRRSAAAATRLAAAAPDWVVRVPTDGRTVVEVARDVVAVTGWAD